MDNTELRRRIVEWTGPVGWWDPHNEDTYVALAGRLIDLGVPAEEALDILSQAHAATCDEYGA